MAVAVQSPLYSKSSMWHLGDPPTAFSTASEGPPVSMAYQYPLPPPVMETAPGGMIPSFHHPPPLHPQPGSPAQINPQSPDPHGRVNSVGSKSAKVKRSMSTPNVRGQSTADAAALALSAEKRRNKLGYHRTSVACGHCRRRKIRCIAAPGDQANRCSNCIRLKKECNFYPVDQQPPQQDPRRRGSKAQSGPEQASEESSSPSISSGQVAELSSTLPYPHLNMPPIQDLGVSHMKRQRTESFSPENKVVTSARNFEYNHGGAAPNWMAPDVSPGTKPPTEVSGAYWRVNPQDSPLTPAFSPYTPGLPMPNHQNWPSANPEASPREDLGWSAPPRSMSYGNLDQLHHQPQQYTPYNHAAPAPVADPYSAKPRTLQSSSGMYPPPISTVSNPIPAPEPSPTPSSDRIPHPQSASSLPPVPYSNWQQAYPYQKPASAGAEPHGGWNGTPYSGQSHSQNAGSAHPPTSAYGYGDPGNVYYPPPPQGR